MKVIYSLLLITFVSADCFAQPKTREDKVREDRERVTADGFWIYNDLPQAFREAGKTGKPILVGLRCIPCEECVKLDDHLVDTDPVIRPLLEQFVCVRVVSTNGLDLSLFQYDTDQSFAMFMLNADRTVYGRFGTRSHRTEWFGDVSLPGLAEALKGALKLHAAYPDNKALLAGKTGAALEFASPEQYPSLRDKYSSRLPAAGEVVRKCIHCHQIGDARRELYRTRGEPIPEKLLFPYPHPRSLGLILDPETRATVSRVVPNSVAAAAGFAAGDQLETLADQPLLSIADLQWVLHNTDPSGAEVPAVVQREGQPVELKLRLKNGWRQQDDIAWRVSSWGLRRMVTGGLKLASLSDDERRANRIEDGAMALQVEHVGQYGEHAVAKRAGFRKGDIIVAFDGRTDLMTPSALLAYGAMHTVPGQSLDVMIMRGQSNLQKKLTMQD